MTIADLTQQIEETERPAKIEVSLGQVHKSSLPAAASGR
jgi:hypothetical protein